MACLPLRGGKGSRVTAIRTAYLKRVTLEKSIVKD